MGARERKFLKNAENDLDSKFGLFIVQMLAIIMELEKISYTHEFGKT